jgi:flagellar assembly protein FliH
LQQTGTAILSGASGCIEVFEYPADANGPTEPTWEGWAVDAVDRVSEGHERDRASGVTDAKACAELEQRLAGETRRSFEAGREQGRLEGRQAERATQAAVQATAQEQRARQVAELIEGFAEQRDRYLQAVEHEAVGLALAIAARILRREAQMDPLLLTGAVRVALGQLSGSTQVRLRVPGAELDLWTETIALLSKLRVKPSVVPGEGMRLGDCTIETELGSVDLGIRAQLGEIEHGFFDRAGGPRASSGVSAEEAPDAVLETRP